MNAEILQFLEELKLNNNRVWFQNNKERYDVLRQGFIDEVQMLINQIALFDPEVAGVEAKECLFRIYRDIRFSPDKTPYKAHFAAYIALGGRASERGGYYIHLEPGNCLLSGGVWCPPPALLKKLRQDIYDHIEEFTAILEEPVFKNTFPVLEGEMLKRMPVGYPMDSPYGYILKHKDFSVVSVKPDSFFKSKDWLNKSVECFKLLLPFNRFLNYTVDEYLGRI
ncbi:DUF2461 domain-containing protein [Parabacteroides bouchesdurhonensis]|uniref:DUF2461 domain-containing protein n=1 Tax=Parabacteroides bouchesdurhonensis TaxID=1936995 RepID=UPI000C82BBF3|nr:DUF2461 domain-containing protein [Parabacteroides bouchesdurhonensis]